QRAVMFVRLQIMLFGLFTVLFNRHIPFIRYWFFCITPFKSPFKGTFQKIEKARLLRRFLFPLPPFLPILGDEGSLSDARRLWRAVLEQFVHEMKSRQAVNQLGVKETVLFLFGVAVIGREQVGPDDFRLIRGLPFDDLLLAELLREFLGVLRRQAAKGDLVAASGHD